jgi:hypothetical protein
MVKIEVIRDYDNFFLNLVEKFCKHKKGEFKHHTIKVNARPFQPDALTYWSKDGVIQLTFYSALRAGFGGFTKQEIEEIIDLL